MLTQKYLLERFYYDENSGVFTWLSYKNNTRFCGKVAGYTDPTGYVAIRLDEVLYKAHRLAWLYMKGELPDGMIDHIDRNRSNNRISNLRVVTSFQNCINRRVKTISKTGLKGVWVARDKFSAYIGIGQDRVRIGLYESAEEAYEAYKKAATKVHGEFSSEGA